MRFRSPPAKLELGAIPPIAYYQQRKFSPMTLVFGSISFMRIFAGVSLKRGIKRQWGCRKWQFLVLSLAISLEALVARPTLLYSRPIVQSLAAFTVTPKYVTLSDHKGHFTLNSLLFCQVQYLRKVPLYLFLGVDNIFG